MRQDRTRRLPLAALAIAAAVVFMPAPAPAEETARTLQVTGAGEAAGTPDMASIQIGVTSDAGTARAALDANTAAMEKVMAAFGGLGIADKDLRTSNFNVQPLYHHDPEGRQAPRVTGYQVNNTVHVTVRDLASLGTVLDAAVSEGSNAIQSLEFTFSKPETLLDEARKAAGADARRKAELYAGGLGVKLGRIVSVSESGGGYQPVPYMRAVAMEAAAPPIATGEQSVSASLAVTWEIE